MNLTALIIVLAAGYALFLVFLIALCKCAGCEPKASVARMGHGESRRRERASSQSAQPLFGRAPKPLRWGDE